MQFWCSEFDTVSALDIIAWPLALIHKTACYNALSYILTDLRDLLMCTPNRITTQLLQPGESITPRRSGGPFWAWPFRHVTTRMTTLLDHPPYESPSTRDLCLGSLQGGQPAPEKHYHAYNACIHVWLWQRNKCSRRESVNAGPRHILWYNIMQSTKKNIVAEICGTTQSVWLCICDTRSTICMMQRYMHMLQSSIESNWTCKKCM